MQQATTATLEEFDPDAFRFYRHAFEILEDDKIPFLLGGAYAFGHYTGIVRHTKDLDLFVRPEHVPQTLDAFNVAGYRSELYFSHWLGKAFHGNDFVDIIFGSGNGACPVDNVWFTRATAGKVLGCDVRLIPVEEMIWQKAYIMERERFDGADVNHLLRACGSNLDWDHLLKRFGPHWRILLAHLILFGFVYPDKRDNVPTEILKALMTKLSEAPDDEGSNNGLPMCAGTWLSRTQYLTDIEEWGFADPRLQPSGSLTKDQVARWTDAGR